MRRYWVWNCLFLGVAQNSCRRENGKLGELRGKLIKSGEHLYGREASSLLVRSYSRDDFNGGDDGGATREP
jgi:hypothetical protein